MSDDFKPRPGHRISAVWPAGKTLPDGWTRVEGWPLIERVATGEPADFAVELAGYTETADFGVSNAGRRA